MGIGYSRGVLVTLLVIGAWSCDLQAQNGESSSSRVPDAEGGIWDVKKVKFSDFNAEFTKLRGRKDIRKDQFESVES